MMVLGFHAEHTVLLFTPGTDVIWKHTDAPAISSTKVDLAAFTSPAATTPTPSAASRPQAVVGSLLVFFFALAAAAVLTM